jgi:hypothetical protein
MYEGSWVTRDPDADMPFRVIGEIDSTEQLEKAIAAVDDFDDSLIQVDSDVPIRQYSVDERTAMDVMDEMLDAGTSTGERLVAWITRDGVVVVGTEDIAGFGDVLPVLGADGKLRFGNGGYYPPGRLIFGTKIDMENLLLYDSMSVRGLRGRGVYIQSSEYSVEEDVLTVQSEGAVDPFRVLTTQRG